MKQLIEILTFRNFVTPILLQVLFWGGIGGNLYGTWWLYTHGNWAWVMSLIFGTLSIRVIFESVILRFRSYEALLEINENLHALRDTTPGKE